MKTPSLSSHLNVEFCKTMETSNKKVTVVNPRTRGKTDEERRKYPVENDEKDFENKNRSGSLGELLVPSSDLPTDVETDEASYDCVQVPQTFSDHSTDNFTSLLDNLKISPSKSKVEDIPLSKMKLEKPVDEPSCDKAAKELSNLLTTLSLSKKPQKPTKENDNAISMIHKLDETLAEFGRGDDVKDKNKKMKSRGFGEGFDSMSDSYNLTLQDQGDLEAFFKRQGCTSFGIIQAEAESRLENTYFDTTSGRFPSQQERNISSVSLPPFHEQFPLRNFPIPGPPTTPTTALEIYQPNPDTSTVTNQFSGVPVPFASDPNCNMYAKRTKLDSEFGYPRCQYPSDTNYSSVNPLNPVPEQCPPPAAFTSVLGRAYSPTFRGSIKSSTMPAPYLPPSSHYSSVQSLSPAYSAYSDSQYSIGQSSIGQSSRSPSSEVTGSGLSPYSSTQYPVSPRSENSSSPTGLTQFSPEPLSDSGIDLTSWYPCNPPSFSNSESPSPTFLSSFTKPYIPVMHNMTTPNQHIQGSNVTTSINQQGEGSTSYQSPLSNYTNHAAFDYTDEDGDCILHILLLVYSNLVNTGKNSEAVSFLNYVKKLLLPHPIIQTKLNHQNYKLQTPLYLAVKHNLLPMVDLLIEAGADVNLQGRGHEDWVKVPQLDAPLHAAVSMGERGLNMVKSMLRSKSAVVNITNTEGETPLHVAAKEHGMVYTETNRIVSHKNCISVVQCLLDKGADMEAKEYKSGKTALMFAIESKDVQLVNTMLEKCDSRLWHSFLNESTHDMNTCMHLAFGLNKILESKHVELIRLLMKRGGEAEAENSSNQKAKDFAPTVYSKAVKIWK